MFRQYLWQGLQAGLAAGLVFGLCLALVGNPLIGFAEAVGHGAEGSHEGGHSHEGGDAGHADHAVSPLVTSLVSIGGGVLWGILLGIVGFGAVFYFLEPAIPGTGATRQYVLAAAGFVTVAGGPWLALPPQPGGLEQSLPQETRMLVYGGMLVAGAVACLASGALYNRLAANRHRFVAVAVALVPLAGLVVLGTLAPANTLSGDVPPAVLAAFRGFALLSQTALWLTMATTHAWLHGATTRTSSVKADIQPAD